MKDMIGIVAILLANIIWGAAPPIFKYSLENIPPFTLGFIRFFIAGLIFWPFVIRHNVSLKRRELKDIVLGGLWGISINVGFFFLGLQLAPSINVHIIGALGPIVLYFFSLMMLKEKPHPQIVKGMFVALLGAIVIILAPLLRSPDSISFVAGGKLLNTLIGNLFFVISLVGSILIVIYTKRVSKTVSPLLITCIQFFVGAFTFAPLMVYELQSWSFAELTFSSWVGIIYGTLFSSAIAYFAHNYAISKMSAQEIGVYSYIMPVIAILVAIPLLGEYPDKYFLIGALFIFLGIFVSKKHVHQKKMIKK